MPCWKKTAKKERNGARKDNTGCVLPCFKKNNTLFDSKRAARANKESTAGALAVHTVSMLQKCMTEKLVLDALKRIYTLLYHGEDEEKNCS